MPFGAFRSFASGLAGRSRSWIRFNVYCSGHLALEANACARTMSSMIGFNCTDDAFAQASQGLSNLGSLDLLIVRVRTVSVCCMLPSLRAVSFVAFGIMQRWRSPPE